MLFEKLLLPPELLDELLELLGILLEKFSDELELLDDLLGLGLLDGLLELPGIFLEKLLELVDGPDELLLEVGIFLENGPLDFLDPDLEQMKLEAATYHEKQSMLPPLVAQQIDEIRVLSSNATRRPTPDYSN